MRQPTLILLACVAVSSASAQRAEGDFIARDFKFITGESLAELRVHYTTLGKPKKNAADNATVSRAKPLRNRLAIRSVNVGVTWNSDGTANVASAGTS